MRRDLHGDVIYSETWICPRLKNLSKPDLQNLTKPNIQNRDGDSLYALTDIMVLSFAVMGAPMELTEILQERWIELSFEAKLIADGDWVAYDRIYGAMDIIETELRARAAVNHPYAQMQGYNYAI